MNVEQRHWAATAEFTAATAAYESALMSGDEAAISAADERLNAADRAFNETLAVLVAQDGHSERLHLPSTRPELRQSLPSFVEMLAHPWCQPAERAGTAAADVVYGVAVAQTAGLPVVGSSMALAGSNPRRYESEAWNAAYNDLFGGTGDRYARVG